ncbi:MAG: aminodeoxychorismate synthase component I [Gammaproteobacteria bacterium]|nr:aminodeoxychorismate synthase component I [Gammaproteobacteria bacterium]
MRFPLPVSYFVVQITALPYYTDASHYFEAIRCLTWPLLLDSNQPASHFGRYDIMMANPQAVIKVGKGQCQLDTGQGFTACSKNAFDVIAEQLANFETINEGEEQLPFYGGAAGLFGYDYGRELEHLPSVAIEDIALADLWVGIYPWAVISDHETQQSWFVSHLPEHYNDKLLARLLATDSQVVEDQNFSLLRKFTSNMTAREYAQKFARVIDYIYAGDCYQVCLAQRFQSQYQGHPWHAYKNLRKRAPTPFSAYMETDAGVVLSLSPERFLEVKNLRVETKPIKGTRPRGTNTESDLALRDELYNSAKDRAENLMIVDLLRNDISKQCLPNSVDVPELFAIESYSNVHHMVTTVTGHLASKDHILRLLRGAFPGGSITGAPKIRAMEIIEELEPHRRNAYTGSIGYISCHGAMDTNILIRTLVTNKAADAKGDIYCWAGGGLVADSNWQAEYQETFDKVNNLLNGLEEDCA